MRLPCSAPRCAGRFSRFPKASGRFLTYALDGAFLRSGRMSLSRNRLALLGLTGRLVILLVPTGLLMGASIRHSGAASIMLWMGTAFQVGVCTLYLINM